jgi:hypothetical protein
MNFHGQSIVNQAQILFVSRMIICIDAGFILACGAITFNFTFRNFLMVC